jgi:hypothetical protein
LIIHNFSIVLAAQQPVVGFIDWLGNEQSWGIEFGDLRRILIVIAIADPCWPDPDVNQAGPTPASLTIGISLVVNLGQTL